MPARERNKVEKDKPTEFDRKIHRQKIDWYKYKFQEGGDWDKEITSCEKYTFVLRGGSVLDIIHFEFKVDEDYYMNDFLLAEIKGQTVGYLWVAITTSRDNNGRFGASSDVEVLLKGRGIGGRLEIVKQLVLQRRANEVGEIENKITDENSWLIPEELEQAERNYVRNGGEMEYKRKVGELLVARQNWLVIYGRGGKGGYTHEDRKSFVGKRRVIYKRYQPNGNEQALDCDIKKSRIDLRKRSNRF